MANLAEKSFILRYEKSVRLEKIVSIAIFIIFGMMVSSVPLIVLSRNVDLWTVGILIFFFAIAPFGLKDAYNAFRRERILGTLETFAYFKGDHGAELVLETLIENFNDHEVLLLLRTGRDARIANGMKLIFGGGSV